MAQYGLRSGWSAAVGMVHRYLMSNVSTEVVCCHLHLLNVLDTGLGNVCEISDVLPGTAWSTGVKAPNTAYGEDGGLAVMKNAR